MQSSQTMNSLTIMLIRWRRTKMIELPMIHVHMLGEFRISAAEKTISDQNNHSKKLWNLLEYLITYRNKEIAQSDLIDLLWGEDESANPTGALKTLMHRVRNMLKELDYPSELIIQRRGTYSWNTNVPCTVDIDTFEKLCLDSSYIADPRLRLEKYRKAIAMYKGDFLPKTNYEPWVVPVSAYYHTMYLKIVSESIDILMNEQSYADVANVCWQALTIDQYTEFLHYNLIRSLYLSGNQRAALKQYSTTTNLFFSKFGVTPSMEFKELYKEIIKINKDEETDLDTIKANLKESQSRRCAFFCEYEFFKDIYRLEARVAEHTGSSIFLCLTTVTSTNGNAPELELLNKSMYKLKEVFLESLRSNDVFARYSISQYILMLPVASYELAEIMLKRAVAQFYRKITKSLIKVSYNLTLLDSEE